MSTTLVVSSVLLATLLGVRHVELTRNKRMFGNFRLQLDRLTTRILRRIERESKRVVECVHKDVLLNILHMVTYSALITVQCIEKGLRNGTVFLRSFKQRKSKESISDNLYSIMEEGNTQEENEHST
jgi:hypothetical protein